MLDGKARVIDLQANDVTEEFIRGAEQVLWIAQMVKAKEAVLKSRSPSLYPQSSKATYEFNLSVSQVRWSCSEVIVLPVVSIHSFYLQSYYSE